MWRHTPEQRRQFDRAVQLDALGLNAAGREMAARDFGVFGRDPQVAPAVRVLVAGPLGRRGDRHAAMPDIEIERRVDLGIVEFHQHVVAGNPELRGAKRHECRNIEAAHPDQVERRVGGAKPQLPARRIAEGGLRHDARCAATAA